MVSKSFGDIDSSLSYVWDIRVKLGEVLNILYGISEDYNYIYNESEEFLKLVANLWIVTETFKVMCNEIDFGDIEITIEFDIDEKVLKILGEIYIPNEDEITEFAMGFKDATERYFKNYGEALELSDRRYSFEGMIKN